MTGRRIVRGRNGPTYCHWSRLFTDNIVSSLVFQCVKRYQKNFTTIGISWESPVLRLRKMRMMVHGSSYRALFNKISLLSSNKCPLAGSGFSRAMCLSYISNTRNINKRKTDTLTFKFQYFTVAQLEFIVESPHHNVAV